MKNKLLIMALILLSGANFTELSLFAVDQEYDITKGQLFAKNEPQKTKFFTDVKNANYDEPISYNDTSWYLVNKEYDAQKNVFGKLQKYNSYFALNNRTIDFNEAKGEITVHPAKLTRLGQLLVGSGVAAMAGKIYYDAYGPTLPQDVQDQFFKVLGNVSSGTSQLYQTYAPQTFKDYAAAGISKAATFAGKASAGVGSLIQTSKTGLSNLSDTSYSYAGPKIESLKSVPSKIKEVAAPYVPEKTPTLADISQGVQSYWDRAKNYFSTAPVVSPTAPSAASTLAPEVK